MRSEYRQDSQTAAEQLTLTAQLGNILIWVRNRNASPFVLSIEARQVYGSAAPRAVCKGGSYIGNAEQKVINHINSSYERSVSNFPN